MSHHHGGHHGHGHGHGHDQKKDDGKRLPIPALSEYPFGGKTKLVTAIGKKYALVTVNVQNDFIGPSGALPIAGAAEVVPVINALRSTMAFDLVVHVRIAHPHKHIAFHSTSVGLHNHALGTTVALPQHSAQQQTLWPAHCVAGTPGAAPPQALYVAATDKVVNIGTDPKLDALSGFASADAGVASDLAKVLNEANISHVFIAGLGYGLWLGQTALDSMRDGFQTYVIADACRPLPPAPSTAGAAAGGSGAAAGGGGAAGASSGSSAAAAAAAAAAGADPSGGCDAMSVALAQGHVTVMDSSVLLLSAPPDNRRTTAERYLERHNILPLFEKLCTALVYHKPADPKAFLVDELKKLADKGRSDRVALFSDDDLHTMFAMLDPLNSGRLTAKQVAHALDSLCVKPAAVHLPQDHTYDLNTFKTKVRQGLQQS